MNKKWLEHIGIAIAILFVALAAGVVGILALDTIRLLAGRCGG